jgi:hypothetical protein
MLPFLTTVVYMNSMLATLNTHRHIRQRIHRDSSGWNSIPIRNLSSQSASATPAPQTTTAKSTIDIGTLDEHSSFVSSTNWIYLNAKTITRMMEKRIHSLWTWSNHRLPKKKIVVCHPARSRQPLSCTDRFWNKMKMKIGKWGMP